MAEFSSQAAPRAVRDATDEFAAATSALVLVSWTAEAIPPTTSTTAKRRPISAIAPAAANAISITVTTTPDEAAGTTSPTSAVTKTKAPTAAKTARGRSAAAKTNSPARDSSNAAAVFNAGAAKTAPTTDHQAETVAGNATTDSAAAADTTG